MKKTIKLSVLTALAAVFALFGTLTAYADEVPDFGYKKLSDYMTEDISEFSEAERLVIEKTRDIFNKYDIQYTNNDIIITSCNISADTLQLSTQIDGYNVVAVEDNVFNTSSYSSVTLPDSLVYLGDGNFTNAAFDITLNEGLVYFGDGNVSKQTETLYIPSTVKYVGCIEAAVGKITVSAQNEYYTVLDGVLYTKDMKTAVKATAEAPSVLQLPSTVLTLQKYAFAYGTGSETVVVPPSVKALGDYVFYVNDSAVRNIYLPEYISISDEAVQRPGSGANFQVRLFSFGVTADVYNYVMKRNNGQSGNARFLYNDLTEITYEDKTYFEYYVDKNFNAIISDCTAAEGTPLGVLTIPNKLGMFTVAGCEDSAFEGQNITEYRLEGESDCFAVVDGVLFSADKEKLICYPAGNSAKTYIVPDTTMSLGNYAFAATKNLIAVAMPKHISTYPWTVFKNSNEGLYIATIPDSVNKSSIKTSAVAYNSIKLTWDAVTNITEYRIYRGTEPSELEYFTTVKNMPYYTNSKCEYVDATVTLGIKYYYAIEPVKKLGTENTVTGKYELPGVAGTSALNIPVISSISSPAYNTIKFSWGLIDGADQGYIIYRTTKSDNTGWKAIATITDSRVNTYSDTTAVCGTKYYYTIRAVRGQIKSGYQKGGTACTAVLETPKIKSAAAASFSSVKLTWNKVAGASGYYLYRSSKSNSGWQKIATVSGGSTVSYTDKSLTCGTTYYYTLRTYRTQNGKTLTSGYVKTGIAGKPVPNTPKLTSAVSVSYNSVKVSWSAVTGANGYAIYRRVSGTTSWKHIKTVSSADISYVDKNLVCGTEYEYTVKAYKNVSSVKVWGGYNKTGIKVTPVPATPNSLKAKVTNLNCITVSWNKISGANGYYVYRKTSKTGWQLIGTVKSGSTVSFVDKNAQYNTTYTYTVRAYRVENGKTVRGGYKSSGVTCKMTYDA